MSVTVADSSASVAAPAAEPVVRVTGLVKDFPMGGLFSRGHIRALGGVDLEVRRGEIMALVGESGSGKSTIARCLARLEQPTSGSMTVAGVDVLRAEPRRASREYRRTVQMVFQDPFGSLNPVHRVDHFLTRALRLHGHVRSQAELQAALSELMRAVDLTDDILDAFPHELSGGQRQRIAIARALAVEPEVILADEPTSMLDVSVRIGILNLMRKLRDERGISMLYITHDLASARYVADRTTVLFAGEVVESGESLSLMEAPAHPYTRLLLSAVPDPHRVGGYDPIERSRLRAAVLEPTRCEFANDVDQACRSDAPVWHRVGDEHVVRCHLYRPRADVARRALTVEAAPATPEPTTKDWIER